MEKLPQVTDEHVLVGQGDDAGVYLLRENLALVQTVDFFTPIVNDPFAYGLIAVANALSDVYAMGAKPITALNIVAFPEKGPPGLEVLGQILAGGYHKADEAGVVILGGHTVDDKEPKYGLAVTGVAHPDDLFSNAGARPGDFLVLTKPIGTGILATALKGEMEPPGTEALLVKTCGQLNADAAQVARLVEAHAVTDVTGFGLALHALDLLKAGEVGGELWFDQIPLLAGVIECLDMGLIPAGTYANRSYANDHLAVDGGVSEDQLLLINDAQTSGGLLMALAPERVDEAVAMLREKGTGTAAVIGQVTRDAVTLRIRPGR